MSWTTGSVVLCVLVGVGRALPRGGLRNHAVRARPFAEEAGGGVFLTQRLDHYDRTNSRTFSQRYFVNASWFNGSGPVFLCVGGEGPALAANVLVASEHCNDMVELAPAAGALTLALEHRYYGLSVPDRVAGETPRERLRFLSTEQAIADLAAFHEAMRREFSLPNETKWVAFGGSYPGLLAGMARLKLPHLFHAAVSSSAPWKAQVDMRVYNDLVGRALSLESVGGSSECLALVADGHAEIKKELDAGRYEALATAFDFCDPEALADRATQRDWAGYGVIEVPAQENDPAAVGPAANIEQICAALREAPGDPVTRLANVSRLQNGRCLDATGSISLAALGGDALSWPWQVCTEYGFFQTCELDSECPFARGYVTLHDEMAYCDTLFNFSAADVADFVAFTNDLYGADRPAATRVYFANGDVDPWSGLGVLVSPDGNRSEIVLQVRGSSHHFWTHPQDTISQPTVRAAKKAIQDQVLRWLRHD